MFSIDDQKSHLEVIVIRMIFTVSNVKLNGLSNDILFKLLYIVGSFAELMLYFLHFVKYGNYRLHTSKKKSPGSHCNPDDLYSFQCTIEWPFE